MSKLGYGETRRRMGLWFNNGLHHLLCTTPGCYKASDDCNCKLCGVNIRESGKMHLRFSNLLGNVYRKGNVLFSPDGNSVLSPVGNRVTIFDLKNNQSETLPLESRLNVSCMALSPDGRTLIAVNEEGEAMLCSLVTKAILSTYHFHNTVHSVKFSPDGKMFAVTRDTVVLLFHTPGKSREFNPFVLYRTFYGCYDETVCLDWTSDSQAFCVGSKDMNTRVYGAKKFENLVVYSVGGHNDVIIGSFFQLNSLSLFSVCANAQLCVWECDTQLSGLVPRKTKTIKPDPDSYIDDTDQATKDKKEAEEQRKDEETQTSKVLYKRLAKHTYKEARGSDAVYAKVSSADFHKQLHLLVTGFEDGAFFLHDMPDFTLIHSLSISDQQIASISFNSTGDWIALACTGLGQLLVWEWQSESYILKQQGHYNSMACVCYSPDGQYLVTGGDDGKVKVWNTTSGFCFVTFNEHLSGVSAVTFTQNGKVIVSASLDGTVRAYDLNRYRNFRTFTSPRVAQFSCLAVDDSGEMVSAGSRDTFEVFLWSLQTGRLLEILAGHESPISSVCFSPGHPLLASGSWDKTVRLWDVIDTKAAKETLTFVTDVLAVCFRPDGHQIAIATLDAQISLWDVGSVTQQGTIEGRHDIGYSRSELDEITAKKSSFGKAFSTICYSADGACILAGGRSKNVCIYSAEDQLLLKKFEITCNMSLDSMQEFLDKRQMTEWGSLALVGDGAGDTGGKAVSLPGDNNSPQGSEKEEFLDKRQMTEWGSLALVDEGAGDTGGKDVSLPGVRAGDKSSRHWRPEVRVTCLQFSPTGRSWAATSTEGLLIYSLDHHILFDPFHLTIDITPATIRSTLAKGDYSTALMLSFKLNEQSLIVEVIESIPVIDIEPISQSLPIMYVEKCLWFLAGIMESSAHLEFYVTWVRHLLMYHTSALKPRSQSVASLMRALQKTLTTKCDHLAKICDHNKYLLQYLLSVPAKRKVDDDDNIEESMDEEKGDTKKDLEMLSDNEEIEPDMLFT